MNKKNIVHWVKPVAVWWCALEKTKITNNFPFLDTFSSLLWSFVVYRCVILNCSHFHMERDASDVSSLTCHELGESKLICVRCVSMHRWLLVTLVCVSVCPFVSRCYCQSRNGLHSRKLFNKCFCWVEFARWEQHTIHRFLDDTKAKKSRVFLFLCQKQYISVISSSSTVAWKQTQLLIVLQRRCHSYS